MDGFYLFFIDINFHLFSFQIFISDIAIIGGNDMVYYSEKDVEVISIKYDSMSLVNTTFRPLPMTLKGLRGTQLPNNDLLVSGGSIMVIDQHISYLTEVSGISDTYLLYNHASKQWKEVGKMKMSRFNHSSVLLNGCVFSCGGDRSYSSRPDLLRPDKHQKTSSHEVISLDGIVKERKELPIALSHHTANKINETEYMICGGYDANVSKTSKS